MSRSTDSKGLKIESLESFGAIPKRSFLVPSLPPLALLLVTSVEVGIRAAHRRGECDRQDLGFPH